MEEKNVKRKECFVIMPISTPPNYEQGHFDRVYEDIIKPALQDTDFIPCRADEEKRSNLIQLEILNKLIEAPIAICDLSTCNPNVMFELGIRQAFDKPVVLIQEKGTPRIFDIAPLRYFEYSKEMKYHEVLSIQEELHKAVIETASCSSKESVNSIIRLLSIGKPASVPKIDGQNREMMTLDLLSTQVMEMRRTMDSFINGQKVQYTVMNRDAEYDALYERFRDIRKRSQCGLIPDEEAVYFYRRLSSRIEMAMREEKSLEARDKLRYLMNIISTEILEREKSANK